MSKRLEKMFVDLSKIDESSLWHIYINNWIWRAVHTLICLPIFVPKVSWVAKKLNISVEKAVVALEGLEELGVIKREKGTYVTTSEFLRINHENCSQQMRSNIYFNNVSQINAQYDCRDKRSCAFLTASPKMIEDMSEELKSVFQKYTSMNDVSDHTEILGTNFTIVNLTKNNENT